MAFKQALIQRMANICNNKFSTQTLRNCRISRSTSATDAAQILMLPNIDRVAPDPGDETVVQRFLSSSGMPEILHRRRESMMETLKEMDITRGRIRLDVLSPLVARPSEGELTVAHAKKILRVSQIEKLKAKLRSSNKNHVSYDEFIEICVQECSNRDQALDLVKALDDSGSVIVLGNVVFLKPEQGRMK